MLNGIKLVRVDFRLIHGQVVTKWSNTITAKTIIVVNDELSEDEFMADIYVMAAPPGIKVEVLSIAAFTEQAKTGQYDKGSILVLFKNIEDVRRTAEQGSLSKRCRSEGSARPAAKPPWSKAFPSTGKTRTICFI